jgi:hypothetical protein
VGERGPRGGLTADALVHARCVDPLYLILEIMDRGCFPMALIALASEQSHLVRVGVDHCIMPPRALPPSAAALAIAPRARLWRL